MSSPTEHPAAGGTNLPERHLSNEQFELVIRRAAELQARAAESSSAGLTEDEVIRIGRELGLSGMHLHQALAEVRGQRSAEHTVLDRTMGGAVLQAARTIPGDADEVRERIEHHLLEREYMVVQRRFPDRTLYVEATGLAATVGRAVDGISRRAPRLGASNLSVAVQPLEEGFSYVTVSIELRVQRAGYTAGALLLGGGGAGTVAVALAIAVAPPAALLGLPVLGGAIYGARWLYAHQARRLMVQLEALLDRLQHGELPPPSRRLRGRR